MALKLQIVTPEKVTYNEVVDEVILPTPEGQIGILTGHIPLITVLLPGEVHAKKGGQSFFLAVDRGFARVFGNTVSLLTEAAIQVKDIDLAKVEEAHARAKEALEKARMHKDVDPVEIEQLEAVTKFSVIQRLIKEKHY